MNGNAIVGGQLLIPSKVPGLIDEEGCFWKSVEDVVGHATMEEVELEIQSQIDWALAFGYVVCHLGISDRLLEGCN